MGDLTVGEGSEKIHCDNNF